MDLRARIYAHQRGERNRVAKAAGITPTYLYMLCMGLKRINSVDLAKRIAAACEHRVTCEELLGLDQGSAPADPAA